MREYIFSLVTVSLCASFVILMSRGGKGGGVSGSVRLLASLCVIVLLISPIKDAAEKAVRSDFFDFDVYEDDASLESFLPVFYKITDGEVLENLYSFAEEKLEIDKENIDFSVEYLYTDEGFPSGIKKITVFLGGAGLLKNPRTVERMFSEYYECECYVV